jgi:hypothetical protein
MGTFKAITQRRLKVSVSVALLMLFRASVSGAPEALECAHACVLRCRPVGVSRARRCELVIKTNYLEFPEALNGGM